MEQITQIERKLDALKTYYGVNDNNTAYQPLYHTLIIGTFMIVVLLILTDHLKTNNCPVNYLNPLNPPPPQHYSMYTNPYQNLPMLMPNWKYLSY